MLKVGLLLLIVPAIAMMTGYMMEQNEIRHCLDQSGVWNYAAERCESSGQFPFVPYMVRNPLLVNGGMLLSVFGLLITIIGLYRPAIRAAKDSE